jgi:hypothetical protein
MSGPLLIEEECWQLGLSPSSDPTVWPLPARTLRIESATSISFRAWMRPLKSHRTTPYGARFTTYSMPKCQAVMVARENISFRNLIPRSGLLRSKEPCPANPTSVSRSEGFSRESARHAVFYRTKKLDIYSKTPAQLEAGVVGKNYDSSIRRRMWGLWGLTTALAIVQLHHG